MLYVCLCFRNATEIYKIHAMLNTKIHGSEMPYEADVTF